MSEGDSQKRRASRARMTRGLGYLPRQFCLADWASETGLPAWPSVEEARERIDEALLDYFCSVDTRDAAVNAREKARSRIRTATENLLEALGTPEARNLLEDLNRFPLASQLNALNSRSVQDDLGEVPGNLERDLRRLRLGEVPGNLEWDLRSFVTALNARVWVDEGDGEADNHAAPDDDGPTAFHRLIGHLRSIFDDAFPGRLSRKFDGFARAMLEAAEVRPVNGAPLSQTAIRDALQQFRGANVSE